MELVERLREIMPELSKVGAWPLRGQQRKEYELGEVASRIVSMQLIQTVSHDTV